MHVNLSHCSRWLVGMSDHMTLTLKCKYKRRNYKWQNYIWSESLKYISNITCRQWSMNLKLTQRWCSHFKGMNNRWGGWSRHLFKESSVQWQKSGKTGIEIGMPFLKRIQSLSLKALKLPAQWLEGGSEHEPEPPALVHGPSSTTFYL